MGKSKETFNKKEKEKKKLKKRQDKELKREERQANNSKGKGLDEMMAYVDEHGNLTTTPPDPSKKIEINVEDIVIGARNNVDEEETVPEERAGIVSYFNQEKGYGFIRDSKSRETIFVHNNNADKPLKEQDKVTFTTDQGPKGPIAVNVKVTG
ncbi:MAG TPA: cold shock domain-containing protein [Bacteroidia bacterium]|nr:cold shock domain-containing protein [Bacteroidia bacterium]